MTVVLSMIVKNEAATLPYTLPTFLPLIDTCVILDTGSTDGTVELISEWLEDVPGELHEAKFETFHYGDARTLALELARGKADWTLMADAEWYAEIHPDLKTWLANDPDPRVAAWMVEIEEGGHRWPRPLLTRNDEDWRYIGVVHEYLDTSGRNTRPLLGLTVHHRPTKVDKEKFARYIELLMPEAEQGEPRATFYVAESYRFSGRTDEAVEWYRKRAAMEVGMEEEAWYASYQAARLTNNLAALIEVWDERPWRHEPLLAASRIVARTFPDAQGDVLFRESPA